MQQQRLLTVQRLDSSHGTYHAEVISNRGQVWKQVAHPQAALTTLPKFPGAAKPDAASTALRELRDCSLADRLALLASQFRLVIK